MSEIYEQIRAAAKAADGILITSQLDPDGDSVGSQLALRQVLITELGEAAADKIAIVNEVGCPPRYAFLPDSDTIVTPADVEGRSFDLGFVLDGGADRTGTARPLFDACKTRVLVDHHKTTAVEDYEIPLIDPEGSSTCELVYGFVEDDRWKIQLTKGLAEQLFVGLVYDTGSFMYALTTPRSHRIAAILMETGIDHSLISERVLMESSIAAKKLLGYVLAEMKVSQDGLVAWCSVSRETQAETGATDDDVRASINHLIFMEGVQVALMFKDRKPGTIKISLRARAGFDVALFARSIDKGGGGHARAAGCSMEGTLDEVATATLAALQNAMNGS